MTPGNPSERSSNTGASRTGASSASASSTSSGTSGTLKASASNVADTAREVTQQAAGQVKEKARGLFSDQKDRAVEGISSVSTALRDTATNLSDQNSPASSIIERAADHLESFKSSLEGKDLDQIVRDVQTFARRKPAVFFGGALAVGFLAARFFKSSAPDDFETSYPTGFDRYPSESPYQSSGLGSSSMSGGSGTDSGYGTAGSSYGSRVSESSSRGTAGSGTNPNRGFGEEV